MTGSAESVAAAAAMAVGCCVDGSVVDGGIAM